MVLLEIVPPSSATRLTWEVALSATPLLIMAPAQTPVLS